MLLPRLALFLPLLAACASDPVAPTPAEAPSTSNPSNLAAPDSPPAAPETKLNANFLVGAWAPMPDVPEIDAKIDALLGGELSEQEAVMMSYLARFFFRADGSCDYGISDRGKFMGSTFAWTAEQVDPHTLRLTLSLDGVEVSEPLAITRLGDAFQLSGDPTLDGSWVPIAHGEDAAAEDDIWGSLGVEHLKYREQIASANAQVEDSLAKRKDGLETLVTLVKTVCEGEDLIGSTDRTKPIRGDDFLQLRDSLTSTEAALLNMPVPSAPTSPVLPEHESSAQAFDEAWLSDRWGFQTEVMDWEVLLGDSPAELRPEIIKILKSRRRNFDIRGEYLNTLGAPQILEQVDGYYSVTPGAGNWVWITILEQHGGEDVGIVDERIETLAAYRIGDVLWLEEAAGHIFPHVRKAP